MKDPVAITNDRHGHDQAYTDKGSYSAISATVNQAVACIYANDEPSLSVTLQGGCVLTECFAAGENEIDCHNYSARPFPSLPAKAAELLEYAFYDGGNTQSHFCFEDEIENGQHIGAGLP